MLNLNNCYVDFTYYSKFYNEPKVSEKEFDILALEATNIIKKYTMNKSIVKYEKIVKDTACLLIDVLSEIKELKKKQEKIVLGTEKTISSEKVGDYSRTFSNVSFNDLKEMISSKEKKIDDIINENLLFTGLLYTGIYVVE